MKVAVGVDLGGTNVRAALVDTGTGAVLADARRPVADREPPAVAKLVGDVVREVDPEGTRCGVGIGFAGMLRGWTGVVANAPNFGWRDVDFRTLLRAEVGERAELYNDLNAIAYGEKTWGAARGLRDVLFVYVGTGVGAGLVLDGKLYIGHSHLAGELGHVKVIPRGRLCGCGQRGCLEAYVSGRNLQARAREDLAKTHSLALELAGSLDALHAGHLDEAALKGDRYAKELMDHAGMLLGVALANAVTVLNPARLVLGGGVWEKSPSLREPTLQWFGEAVNRPSVEGFDLADGKLGDLGGVLGAAALIADL